MLEASTSAIRNGTGLSLSRLQTSRVTGATSSTVVTLSRSADAPAVSVQSSTSNGYGRPRVRLALQIARNSKSPVRRSPATTSIIPSSRKMTFQSMPVSSEKKASSAPTIPTAKTAATPPRAAVVRGTRSVAISA